MIPSGTRRPENIDGISRARLCLDLETLSRSFLDPSLSPRTGDILSEGMTYRARSREDLLERIKIEKVRRK